jgi:hypothetical protein
MSRYVKDLPTALGVDQANAVINAYLQAEGFAQKLEQNEQLWRKGVGALVVPQFIKATPADRTVHIEAWTAGLAIIPGVYTGEMDPMSGIWGAAVKVKLKKRVLELERLLTQATQTPDGGPAPVDS